MNLVSCLFVISSFILRFARWEGAGNWGYHSGSFYEPSRWMIPYKSCGGYRQSGVDIQKSQVQYWRSLSPVLVMPKQTDQKVSLKKIDMTIYLTFSNIWTISFNGVGCFRPLSIHWHWGSLDSQGSEHSIDGVSYAMEAHLVTYNCDLYNTSEAALVSASGLYVFGMLYQVGPENAVINILLPSFNLSKVSVTIPEIPPASFLPTNLKDYYRYEGSLTTPPCSENVIWTVFREVQTIGRHQIDQFRSLQFGKPESGRMVNNFRPITSLTDSPGYVKRVVYASFSGGPERLLPSFMGVITTLLVQTLSSRR